jgi:oxalate decarboxylase
MGVVLYDNARVTVMNPDETMFIGDVSEGRSLDLPRRFPAFHSGSWPGCHGVSPGLQSGQLLGRRHDASLRVGCSHPARSSDKNTGLEASIFDRTPGAPLYIFPGTVPGSLEQDKAEVGGEQVASKYQYTFHMKSMLPTPGEQRRLSPRCGLAELPRLEAHRWRFGDGQARWPA